MELRLVFFAHATPTFTRANNASLFTKRNITEPGTGVMLNTAPSRTVTTVSTIEHGGVQINVDFNVPKDSSSGLQIHGSYEIQVFDSFGKGPIVVHDCGALYERWDPKPGKGKERYEGHTPTVNASKPSGERHNFDITIRAPRFDASGKKVENARFIKVVHNDKVIHENPEMTGSPRGAKLKDSAASSSHCIRGNHGPVVCHHLTITPLATE